MSTIKKSEIDIDEILLASIEHPIAAVSKQDIEKIIGKNANDQN